MDTDILSGRFERNPDLIWTDVDGETVMLSIERGEYFGLGGIGGHIWQLLAEPVTVDEICQSVVAEFDVDADTCRADVSALLMELLDNEAVFRSSDRTET